MPIRGEATAILSDGRQLKLKINFATLARVAAHLDMQPQEVFSVLEAKAHPKQMLVALAMLEWALKRNHPDIDEDALGDLMMDGTDAHALIEANKSAMIGAFGDKEADSAETDKNPPRRGTGTRSKSGGRKRAKK